MGHSGFCGCLHGAVCVLLVAMDGFVRIDGCRRWTGSFGSTAVGDGRFRSDRLVGDGRYRLDQLVGDGWYRGGGALRRCDRSRRGGGAFSFSFFEMRLEALFVGPLELFPRSFVDDDRRRGLVLWYCLNRTVEQPTGLLQPITSVLLRL